MNTPLIALLGRRDQPTDGVEDYCTFLGRALSARGLELSLVRVAWEEEGWKTATRNLQSCCRDWHDRFVLLQYTALAWSGHGFPLRVLTVASTVRRAGAQLAIVFHESGHQGGLCGVNRIRAICQDWVIQRLYAQARRAFFTVPLESVSWLPKDECKSAFIPIGANIPERLAQRFSPKCSEGQKTIVVFGVTGQPRAQHEIEDIAYIMRKVDSAVDSIRLVLVGRGTTEVRESLTRALESAKVQLVVRGILPAEDIAREFEGAHALLFVRGAISPQRGSAIAGIACGLPIVGYQQQDISQPLREAGIEWAPFGNREVLAQKLIRVLTDRTRWIELHERNLRAQKEWFSWNRIAEKFSSALRIEMRGQSRCEAGAERGP